MNEKKLKENRIKEKKQKEKNTFHIGELSKLFDISPDSIRYYEEVGILEPQRNPQNNYRLYSIEDVRRIVLIRELLDLNFSTDQIREFTTDRNLKKTLQMLEKEMSAVNEQILNLYEKKNNILNRLSNMQKLLLNGGDEKVHVLDLPDRPCVMVTDSHLPDTHVDYYVIRYMHSHRQKIATIGACDCYSLNLPESNPDSLYYRTRNVFFYSPYLPAGKCNHTLPAGKYLSLIYRGPLTKTRQLMPQMLDFMKEKNYEMAGDPIEFCHIDDYETAREDEYLIELQIPVKAGAVSIKSRTFPAE